MLKQEQYRKTVYRPYPPLISSLFMSGYSTESHYLPLIGQPLSMQNTVIVDGVWYYSDAEMKRGAAALYEFVTTLGNVKKLWQALKQKEDELLEATSSDLKTFVSAYQAYMPALMIAWLPEDLIESSVRGELSAKLTTDEVNALMSSLNIPVRDNFYKQAEYDLVTTTNLTAHVKKYKWLVSRYGANVTYTEDEAQKRLARLDKERYLEERARQKKQIEETIKQAKEILGEKRHLVDAMQFIVYYRTQRTDMMNRAFFQYIPKLHILAQQNELSYDQLLYTTVQELLHGEVNKSVIEQRIQDQAMILENGLIRCVIGQEAQTVRELVSMDTANISQITGQIACGGTAVGNVRVVRSVEDFLKVNAGDVLVTSMTSPNMVPIMRLAAAFVTDEGGITCHAAIISREMKKPCIIGTKIATQVLKDGDMVKVDANKGIVSKL